MPQLKFPRRQLLASAGLMRRAFEHPLAPALGCAMVCVVYLLAQPATADMAAHAYRTWLFQHGGADGLERAVVRRAPRARLLAAVRAAGRARSGPRCVGRRSPPWSRSPRSCRSRARRADAVGGRRPARVAVHRRRALQRRSSGGCRSCSGSRSRSPRGGARSAPEPAARALAAVLALASMLGEPVAGVFLLLAPPPARLARGRAALGPAARARAAGAGRRRSCWRCCSPRAATDRFVATAFWPMLASRAAAALLLAPRPRIAVAGGLLYLAVLVGAFVVPVAVRAERAAARRAARPGAARCSPARGRVPVRRSRSSASAALPAVAARRCARSPRRTATRRTRARPSRPRRARFLARGRQARRARRGPAHAQPLGGRRPGQGRPARARLGAPARPEGQPDLLRRPAADRRPLPRAGCATTRVRWVALPNAPLDYSAAGRGAAARARGASTCSSSMRRRAGASGRCATPIRPPPAARAARGAARTGSMVDTRPADVVRQRYTRYWSHERPPA